MTGEYKHCLDSKGRLFIPARLREELGDVVFLTGSMDGCLCAYSASKWQELSEKANSLPIRLQRKMRPLFSFASRCELDSQGRVLVPANMREYAGLTKSVTVVGCNNHAELWNTDSWAEVNENEITPENFAAVMEELEF